MTIRVQVMNWYNSLPHYSLYSFKKLANLFLEYFSINIEKRASITDTTKLSQLDQESISDYVSRWRNFSTDMSFSLPQEELMRLFSKGCNKQISTLIKIQQLKNFKQTLSQTKIIEEVIIQNREIKLAKKLSNQHNDNRGYNANKNGGNIGGKPQVNQVVLQSPHPSQPPLRLHPQNMS